jgi:hypothetical protein
MSMAPGAIEVCKHFKPLLGGQFGGLLLGGLVKYLYFDSGHIKEEFGPNELLLVSRCS